MSVLCDFFYMILAVSVGVKREGPGGSLRVSHDDRSHSQHTYVLQIFVIRLGSRLEAAPEYDLRFCFTMFPCRLGRTWIPRTPKGDKGDYSHRTLPIPWGLSVDPAVQGAPELAVGTGHWLVPNQNSLEQTHGQSTVHGLSDVPLSYDVVRVRLGRRRKISIPKGSLVPSRSVEAPRLSRSGPRFDLFLKPRLLLPTPLLSRWLVDSSF